MRAADCKACRLRAAGRMMRKGVRIALAFAAMNVVFVASAAAAAAFGRTGDGF